MSREEFINYIESIGFKYIGGYYSSYKYKGCEIEFFNDHYYFFNGSKLVCCEFNDLKPLEKEFKRELRSIKLKQLLR